MKSIFSQIRITGVATVLPAQTVELSALTDQFEADYLERAIASTGVRRIRVAAPEQCASDLCAEAAQRLLAALSVDPATVDGLVFVTQTPDWIIPATSPHLQHRLGLPTTAATYDLNFGCSGYVLGLLQAAMLLQSGCARVLVCTGDTFSRYVHPQDKAMRMVIGDAGNATLVERGEDQLAIVTGSDGSGADYLIIPAGGSRRPRTPETAEASLRPDGNIRSDENIFMDGMQVMRFALTTAPQVIEETLALAGWAKEAVGYFILHQANKLIVDSIRKKLRVPEAAVPVVLRDTGNTGPSSIPLALNLLAPETPAARWRQTILCGFGIGLSYGAVAANLAQTHFLPMAEL